MYKRSDQVLLGPHQALALNDSKTAWLCPPPPPPLQITAVLLIFKDQTCLRKNILRGSHALNQIIFEMIY